jgi:hypothetical protein
MKTFISLFAALGCLSLSSCIVPVELDGAPGIGYYNTVLPPLFVGDAYWYGGRYFYGGAYYPGHFYHYGRYYDGRYYHHGHYYYGGRYEHHDGHRH